MLVSEFIDAFVYGSMKGELSKPSLRTLMKNYERKVFFIPRILCRDGFSISLVANRYGYCGSENGLRTFGLHWELLEWGFPSEEIDAKKFNSEKNQTIDSIGGYVDVELIDELCEQHGGFDLKATLANDHPNE